MDTPLLTRYQSQALDVRAIDDYGMSSLVLMENAGRGTVDVLERLGIAGPVVILAGKGNNAGDGFVIARHLAIRGYQSRVILLGPADKLKGDAAANFAILKHCGVSIIEWTAVGAASRAAQSPSQRPPRLGGPTSELDRHASGTDWLVDAMLGTGASGEPRPPFDTAIDWMNAQPCKKLAIDVPSGLDCDTGEAATHTVRADHTCTFAAMKIGFTLGEAARYTGTVHVCDIGVPPRLIDEGANQ